jgi:hypothetical protein
MNIYIYKLINYAYDLTMPTELQGDLTPKTMADSGRGPALVDIALNMIRFMSYTITTVAVLSLITGAVLYLQSYGKEGMVTKAKTTIKWGIWGMILGLLSFTIVTLITNSLNLVDKAR